MTTLNRSTCRRLQKLPQINSVWEGDRRTISAGLPVVDEQGNELEVPSEGQGECIIWVDGSEGMVRSMDMVAPEIGPEAVVRTLLRAIEYPQGPAKPALPQKIVVRDREIQFYLRGVLQDLDIVIDYVPNLPLIDRLFRELQSEFITRPPKLPLQYAQGLLSKARNFWQASPWDILAEYQVLSIELNRWDVSTLYVSVMGMLGEEYGILLYRSLDSLKQFRAGILAHDSIEKLEEAFLKQDCLFLTFELSDESELADDDESSWELGSLPFSEIDPNFGTLHPLEGLRSIIYEEEALVMYVALEALGRFIKSSRKKITVEQFPALKNRYNITLPPVSPGIAKRTTQETPQTDAEQAAQKVQVKVATLPNIAAELFEMVSSVMEADSDEDCDQDSDEDSDEWDLQMPQLREDMIPDNSLSRICVVSWEGIEQLRKTAYFYQAAPKQIPAVGNGLPVVIVQTSKPKAKALIQNLQTAEGLEGIGFNPGEDPYSDKSFDLGIFQTGDGDLYLFEEFEFSSVHTADRQKWDDSCKKTKGYCGLIIAMGMKGASKGNPQLKDMLALFEVRSLSEQELGLGVLQRMP
ncbi:MAG: hypothetical protein GDA38_23875 [Hormoscilla sp. SP12CHS1]|nr:hypothetical protein [Hormoscilla sp. SP12CHS1]